MTRFQKKGGKQPPVETKGGASPSSRREVSQGRRAKSIKFLMGENKVRFIRVPPRSRNKEFWFTETQRIVRKGLQFEVEPNIHTHIEVTCRLHLSTLAMSASSASSSSAVPRSVLMVLEEGEPLFGGVSHKKWLAVGTVSPGQMVPIKVVFPPGNYLVRCEGECRLQVFGQSWDVERELV